jgi:hypothetical protein
MDADSHLRLRVLISDFAFVFNAFWDDFVRGA